MSILKLMEMHIFYNIKKIEIRFQTSYRQLNRKFHSINNWLILIVSTPSNNLKTLNTMFKQTGFLSHDTDFIFNKCFYKTKFLTVFLNLPF